MEFRSAAFAAAALAAVTFLAGCNKGVSNTNSTNSNSTSNAGATTSPSVKSITTTTSGGAATPTDAFKMYYSASKSKDVETIKALFPRATLKNLEDQARAANKSTDDILRQGLEAASEHVPATMPETRNEQIDGDHATLEIKDDQKGSWDTIQFIKEDGQWKLSFPET